MARRLCGSLTDVARHVARVMTVRLPRAVLAILAGGSLPVCANLVPWDPRAPEDRTSPPLRPQTDLRRLRPSAVKTAARQLSGRAPKRPSQVVEQRLTASALASLGEEPPAPAPAPAPAPTPRPSALALPEAPEHPPRGEKAAENLLRRAPEEHGTAPPDRDLSVSPISSPGVAKKKRKARRGGGRMEGGTGRVVKMRGNRGVLLA